MAPQAPVLKPNKIEGGFAVEAWQSECFHPIFWCLCYDASNCISLLLEDCSRKPWRLQWSTNNASKTHANERNSCTFNWGLIQLWMW
jgi:hypothetical protein